MLYIIVLGTRWYLSLSQKEASAFKRFYKADKILRVLSDKTVLNGIAYVPEFEKLLTTFKLKIL